MRKPTAMDALVRWLALTLTGSALIVLVPSAGIVGESLFPSSGWAGVRTTHLAGLVVIALGWVIFLLRIVRLGETWRGDHACLALMVGCLLGSVAILLSVVYGTQASVIGSAAITAACQVALALRAHAKGRSRSQLSPTPV